MRLNSALLEQTLSQFDAQLVPDTHPAMGQLKNLFGDHTFFLADNGLNIVEPIAQDKAGQPQSGRIVNLADWTDGPSTSLAPHEPQTTDVVIEFTDGGSPKPH